MATTTNFQEWLDNLEDKDIEDIYCLYESVVTNSAMGSFNSSKNNGVQFIQNGENDQILMLTTSLAVNTFLSKLDVEYSGNFGSVQGHYEFVRSMRKED